MEVRQSDCIRSQKGKNKYPMKKINQFNIILKNRGFRNIPHILQQHAAWKAESFREKQMERYSQHPLRVAFELTGGMGDYIIAANYLAYFLHRYGIFLGRITLYFPNGFGLAQAVFSQNGRFLLCEKSQYVNPGTYDLYFTLSRFPRITYFKEYRIRRTAPQLLQYIGICKAFELQHPYFFRYIPFCDGQAGAYCEVIGQLRLQQPDFCGFLGIKKQYRYRIPVLENENAYLDNLQIKSGQFLTIHHGCDTQYASSTKLWPLDYYEKLVRLILRKYPQMVIVQIGVSAERFPEVAGVSRNLVGRTNMEQVKVLLKHSFLHIDNEGGMVHLRHALCGGKSIVLFGPTSDRFYGYPENENLRSNICPRPCEWLTADWSIHCLRRDYRTAGDSARNQKCAECMEALLPETVMERAAKFLDGQFDIQEGKSHG